MRRRWPRVCAILLGAALALGLLAAGISHGVYGRSLKASVYEIILRRRYAARRTPEEEIARLPRLKKIIMVDCGLKNEEMGYLQEQHPEVKFVWTVKIGPHTIRTDVIGFSTCQSMFKSLSLNKMQPSEALL